MLTPGTFNREAVAIIERLIADVDALRQIKGLSPVNVDVTGGIPIVKLEDDTGIEVRTASSAEGDITGAIDLFNVNTITLDTADGFVLSSPVDGEARIDFRGGVELIDSVDGSPDYFNATKIGIGSGLVLDNTPGYPQISAAPGAGDPDASLTQRGYVNLSPQSLGAGAKYFSDKVGIGTAPSSPALANSALDVRGYTYVYFAGIISFGGGNTPVSEAAGAIIQYDGSAGNKNISMTIAAQDYGTHMAGGILIQGTNARFILRHKTASQPRFGYFNDDTAQYTDGQTVTELGVTYTGGLRTGGAFSGGFTGTIG